MLFEGDDLELRLLKFCDCLGLVALDADDDVLDADRLGEILRAANDLVGAFEHDAIVAVEIGLALRAV